MSDLNVAAAQLESNIDGLAEKVTQTIAEGEELKGIIEQAKGSFESEWSSLEESANALRELVETSKQAIETGITALYESIADLGEQAGDAREKVEQLLVEAQQQLLELQNQAMEEVRPAVEEVLESVKSVHDGFAERVGSIQEELGGVVSEAHEFLASETVAHLDELKSLVEQGHQQVEGFITGELVPQIEQQVQDYVANLTDIGGQLQERFETAQSTFHDNASSALQDMLGQFTEGTENVTQFAQQVDGVIETFKGLIDAGGITIATGKEVVQTGVDTTNVGLNAVIGTLEELKEFFGRFSFVSI